jgi:membrane protein YdbS with pleckstrin-like domain
VAATKENAMEQLSGGRMPLINVAWKPLAWVGGVIATVCAAAVGAVLAIVFAASLVVIALMAAVLLVFAGLALRARRTMRRQGSDIIEARHMGGGSWVAYGWDQHGR